MHSCAAVMDEAMADAAYISACCSERPPDPSALRELMREFERRFGPHGITYVQAGSAARRAGTARPV